MSAVHDGAAGRRWILFDFFGTLVTVGRSNSIDQYAATHALAAQLGYRGDRATFVADWYAAAAQLEASSATSHVEHSMTDEARTFAQAASLDLATADLDQLGSSFAAEWRVNVRRADGMLDLPAAGTVFVGDTYEPDFLTPRQLGFEAFLITADDERVPRPRRLRSLTDLDSAIRRAPDSSSG